MLRYGRYDNLRQNYSNSHKITKREDISNPFEVLERHTLDVENIVEKNKYLTILFFSQLYTHLHTCQKSHPHTQIARCPRAGSLSLAEKYTGHGRTPCADMPRTMGHVRTRTFFYISPNIFYFWWKLYSSNMHSIN